MNSQYSDEMINAFVDDELDSREKEAIKTAMETDAELFSRIRSVCDLKKSLQQSYADVSVNESMDTAGPVVASSRLKQAVAALLLLCVGTMFGWYVSSTTQNLMVSTDMQGLKLTQVNMQQPNKIILHVSSSQGNTLQKTLQKVEYIIAQYETSQLPYEVEVIANSGGIDLLRQDVSPYADEIFNIMSKHDNISFIACSNAIERLKIQGIDPKMIVHTKTGGTAVEQIVKRLQQGWVYIKV